MNIDGTEDQPLGLGREPRWSPDGSRISYWNWHDDDTVRYWTMGSDGFSKTVIGEFPSGTLIFWWDGPAEWSPDGRRLLYAQPAELCDGSGPLGGCRSNPDSGVWSVRADGTDARRLVAGNAKYPSWAPDGTRIAFARGTSLLVADADGNDRRTLHTSVGIMGRPQFSPDGSQVAFTFTEESVGLHGDLVDRLGVGVVGVDGSDARTLVRGRPWARVRAPQWSPDGTMLVFADAAEVTLARPATGDVRTIATTGYDGSSNWLQADPSWSPDGAWIVTGAANPNNGQWLHVVRPDGTDLTPIGLFPGESPSWRP